MIKKKNLIYTAMLISSFTWAATYSSDNSAITTLISDATCPTENTPEITFQANVHYFGCKVQTACIKLQAGASCNKCTLSGAYLTLEPDSFLVNSTADFSTIEIKPNTIISMSQITTTSMCIRDITGVNFESSSIIGTGTNKNYDDIKNTGATIVSFFWYNNAYACLK